MTISIYINILLRVLSNIRKNGLTLIHCTLDYLYCILIWYTIQPYIVIRSILIYIYATFIIYNSYLSLFNVEFLICYNNVWTGEEDTIFWELSSLDLFTDGILNFDPIRDAIAHNISAGIQSDNTGVGSSQQNIPPLASQEDLLTTKCNNQLSLPELHRRVICSVDYDNNCRLDTKELRNELVRRYIEAGKPGDYVVKTIVGGKYDGEQRLLTPGETKSAKMTLTIFNAIKR